MGLSNELSCEAGSFSCHLIPHRFFQSEVLRLYFPVPGPCIVWSVWLPSVSSPFVCTQMWDHLLHQPPPCCLSSPPCCLSPPLLPVWLNVSSLCPWLSDFHTVRFSGSSGCFLFLKLLLSLFWLFEEAQCIYLYLRLCQKSLLVLIKSLNHWHSFFYVIYFTFFNME